MRRPRRVVALALVVLLAVPAIALGAKIASLMLPDAANDSPAKFDIENVTVDTTGDGMIRHVVTLAADFSPNDMIVPSGPQPAICVLIWTRRPAGDDRPDYELCATATEDGRKLRGTLAKLPSTGLPKRVAIVEADRPSARSVALEVTPADLGKPRSYRFSAQVAGPTGATGAACGRFTGCVDYAPERGTFKVFAP